MMHPGRRRDTIRAIIQREESGYSAQCLELPVVTQGETLEEVVQNLHQEIALHLEGENIKALGLAEHPRVKVIYDTTLR